LRGLPTKEAGGVPEEGFQRGSLLEGAADEGGWRRSAINIFQLLSGQYEFGLHPVQFHRRQCRNNGLPILIQKHCHTPGIPGLAEYIVDTRFLVHPDLHGVKGTLGVDFYKALVMHRSIPFFHENSI
jgi:hypothetical protein